MIFTVTTDASFSTRIKRGTYAFQVKSNKGCHQYSGVFKDEVGCNTEAELKAIGNALAYLVKQNELSKGDFIIINTDCFAAIMAIKHQASPRGSTRLKLHARKIYRYLVAVHSVRHEFRHVKAHTNVQDKRSHVNRWCDKKAGEEMNKLLKQHGYESLKLQRQGSEA